MIPFDPIKAIREEIAGLADVAKVISARERAAEAALGQAEAELNAVRKLSGFAKAELARKREVLAHLEAKEEGR